MNLRELHEYTGKLLAAGAPGVLPVVSLSQGEVSEVVDVALIDGEFKGDPSPQMVGFRRMSGQMLVLVPVTEDVSELVNAIDGSPATHVACDLPVEPPYC
jgi:hypothetical protein